MVSINSFVGFHMTDGVGEGVGASNGGGEQRMLGKEGFRLEGKVEIKGGEEAINRR